MGVQTEMTRHNSDRHELLCYTEQGHVLRCVGCGGLRVQFRDVVLDLAPDDLETLRNAIAPVQDTVLYVGANRLRFSFTAAEVVELNRLLDRAHLILCLNESELNSSLQAASLFPTPPMTVRSRAHARA